MVVSKDSQCQARDFRSGERKDRVAVELSSSSSRVHDLVAASVPSFSDRDLDLVNVMLKIATSTLFRFVFPFDPVVVVVVTFGRRGERRRAEGEERDKWTRKRDRARVFLKF